MKRSIAIRSVAKHGAKLRQHLASIGVFILTVFTFEKNVRMTFGWPLLVEWSRDFDVADVKL